MEAAVGIGAGGNQRMQNVKCKMQNCFAPRMEIGRWGQFYGTPC